jgi:hypothetical protein
MLGRHYIYTGHLCANTAHWELHVNMWMICTLCRMEVKSLLHILVCSCGENMLQAKPAIKQFISVQWIFVRHSLQYLVQEICVCISISLPFLKVGTVSQDILTVVDRKTRFGINSLNTGFVFQFVGQRNITTQLQHARLKALTTVICTLCVDNRNVCHIP